MDDKIIEIKEKKILIATRVPPSDNWRLISEFGDNTVYPSLTDALEAYFQKTKQHTSFHLDPLDSKLYSVIKEEVVIEPVIEKPKEYGIYNFK